MAGENTAVTLSANFKEIYADKLENLLPKGLKFQRDIKFSERDEMPGGNYNQPVLLQHEHGFTYEKSGSTTAFSLADAVAGATANAQILGSQMMLVSRIGIELAARAAKGGTQAFRRAFDVIMENMTESSRKRMEIDYFHGKKGIGNTTGATIVTGASGTITFTKAEWAPGIWAGQEKAVCVIYSAGATTLRGTTHEVSGVDMVARKITFTTLDSGVVAGDIVFFNKQVQSTGPGVHHVFDGLHSILDNPTTLHGITTASFSLWQPNKILAGGPLTWSVINSAIPEAVGRGLDEDVVAYISPEVWADLLDDETDVRRHNEAAKTGRYDVGAEGLMFYSQNGSIEIKPSIYVKNGYAFIIPPRYYRRIGSTDLTFRLPDRGDEFFRHLDGAAGYELRAYVNHSLFTRAPAFSILLHGITT